MPRYLTKQKSGYWHYQMAVPQPLQDVMGKQVIVRHVPPCSPRDAENRIVEWVAADKRRLAFLRTLPAGQRQEIADAGGLDAYCKRVPAFAQSIAGMTALPDAVATLPADQLERLRAHGVSDDQLAGAAIRARQHGLSLRPQLEFAQEVARKTADRPAESTLDGLLALWEKIVEPKHTRRHTASMELLKAFLGDPDVHTITFDDMARWRDHLVATHTPVMADDHWRKVKAILGIAVDERKLRVSPMAGLKMRPNRGKIRNVDRKAKKRKAFSGTQLRLVLAKVAAKPMRNARRKADMTMALRLLIWTGARPGEVCQLRREDVGTEDGIAFIHVRDEHVEQSTKAAASVRRVPLHPAIKADYLAFLAGHAAPWVFRSFVHRGDSGRSTGLTEWFSPILREDCEITDKRLVLYSVRHTFHDAMRNAKIHPDIQRALVGHEGRDVHEKVYGEGPALTVLAAELAKVDPLA